MAPEYALWGCLTYKADVYSFGVVALEIVAGKNNMKFRPNDDFVCLVDWVRASEHHALESHFHGHTFKTSHHHTCIPMLIFIPCLLQALV